MVGSLTLKVKEQDQTKKQTVYKLKTTDPEVVEIYAKINQEAERLIMEINVPSDGTPPPVDDKNPIVEAGQDITVKQGALVTLVGSAKDDGKLTSIQWILPDSATDANVDEVDPTKITFKAPTLGTAETIRLLQCILEVEDDRGNKSTDNCIVTVLKDIITPPTCPIGTHKDPMTGICIPDTPTPTGEIYNCITVGKWNINRTITDYDKLFPKPFVNGHGISINASGANKRLEIVDGVATLLCDSQGHPRWYLDNSNYSTATIYALRFNDLVARNHTQQKQSRHNMGGAEQNRFGGFNHEIDIEGQKVALKMELWHTDSGGLHIEGGDSPLPEKLLVDAWVKIKNTDMIEGRMVHSSTELDYGNGWVMGHHKKYDLSDSKYDFIFDEQLYRNVSSEWFRMNPSGKTKGFSVKDLRVMQL